MSSKFNKKVILLHNIFVRIRIYLKRDRRGVGDEESEVRKELVYINTDPIHPNSHIIHKRLSILY